jgi:hypothetical protein
MIDRAGTTGGLTRSKFGRAPRNRVEAAARLMLLGNNIPEKIRTAPRGREEPFRGAAPYLRRK